MKNKYSGKENLKKMVDQHWKITQLKTPILFFSFLNVIVFKGNQGIFLILQTDNTSSIIC